MEIIVQGKGESIYTPNQVVLNLSFSIKGESYNEVLTKGGANVLAFINQILLPQGFTKEDLKTSHFMIREETTYNENTKTYDFSGYLYIQNATLKFDYEKEKISAMMELVAKMDNPPYYKVSFTVKDKELCRKENLAKAYQDALEQAQMIASAAGVTLKQCAKVDFKPFTTGYEVVGYDSKIMYEEMNELDTSAAAMINMVFTPEDITISETLYCLWIAE